MSQFDPALGLPAEFADLWSSAATATVTTLSSSGDLVAIHHTDRHGDNTELTVVDILRVVDGRITEYWGVVGADRPVAGTLS